MNQPDDDNEGEEWKGGTPFCTEPIKPLRGPYRILLISGPRSGVKMEVPELDEGQLIRDENGVFFYYEQDQPGSVNYYFKQDITDYFNTHKETVTSMFGHRIQPREHL